ncbi:MAG: glycosyltransferase [Fimbriimonas sp.]|nr:glycosyltransferase [Fimbriimonas sp.]
MARVTVCLSVFNGADTLADSLASVFAQTYRDFNVLVLDDGSTDNSAEVARRFNCRVLEIPNGGRGAALRRMVEEADGEFIALIDHDDVWLPEKLAKQVEQLDRTGASLVHADCWYEHSDGRAIDRDLRLPPNACSFDHIIPGNEIIASSTVFRRDQMIAAGNFASDTLRCCDWYGWFVLAPRHKFDHLPEKLVRYKVLTTSLANAGYRFFEAQHYLLSEKILPRAHELFGDLPPRQARRYKGILIQKSGIALSSMARAMEQKGDKRAARALHRRAIRTAPGVLRVWTRALRSLAS